MTPISSSSSSSTLLKKRYGMDVYLDWWIASGPQSLQRDLNVPLNHFSNSLLLGSYVSKMFDVYVD